MTTEQKAEGEWLVSYETLGDYELLTTLRHRDTALQAAREEMEYLGEINHALNEARTRLTEENGKLREATRQVIKEDGKVVSRQAKEIVALREENERLREALTFCKMAAESFHKGEDGKARALAVIAGHASEALASPAPDRPEEE